MPRIGPPDPVISVVDCDHAIGGCVGRYELRLFQGFRNGSSACLVTVLASCAYCGRNHAKKACCRLSCAASRITGHDSFLLLRSCASRENSCGTGAFIASADPASEKRSLAFTFHQDDTRSRILDARLRFGHAYAVSAHPGADLGSGDLAWSRFRTGCSSH